MKILAISTSSNTASVALLEDNICIQELNICNEKTHSEKLMPLVDNLLKTNNITLSNINLLACDIGPGSFTGIRIGVSSVKAMSEVKNIPIVSCTSLEGLAYNVTGFDYICSLIDARNNQVYAGIFDKNYCLVSEYMADDISNLIPLFNKYQNIAYVGDGSKYINASSVFDYTIHSKNIGISGYKKYLQGETTNADNLSIMYLRKSQAERMRRENG